MTKAAKVQSGIDQRVCECIRGALQQAFPFLEEVGRARVKATHAQEVRLRPGQRLGGSSAKPFGDPFMQGQAPAVFPRQVRNERDMDAETGGRGQPLQRAQARSLGSSLIRYLIVQDVRRPVAPSTSNLVRDRATSPRRCVKESAGVPVSCRRAVR